MGFSNAPCPKCGGQQFHDYDSDFRFWYLTCLQCGYSDTRPSAKALEDFEKRKGSGVNNGRTTFRWTATGRVK